MGWVIWARRQDEGGRAGRVQARTRAPRCYHFTMLDRLRQVAQVRETPQFLARRAGPVSNRS